MFRGENREVVPSLGFDRLNSRLTAFHHPERNAIDAAKGHHSMQLQAASEALGLGEQTLKEAMTSSDTAIDLAIVAHLKAQRNNEKALSVFSDSHQITATSPGIEVLAREADLSPREFVINVIRELETRMEEAGQAVKDSNVVLGEIHPALAGDH